MNARLKSLLVSLIVIGYLCASTFLFLNKTPHPAYFALLSAFILCVQLLDLAPLAYMATGFATLMGVLFMTRLRETHVLQMPVLILSLWACVFVLHLHLSRGTERRRKSADESEEIEKNNRVLRQETGYYEKRRTELSSRSQQRKTLSRLTREMGALLDPQKIQARLVAAAQELFVEKPVDLSYGQKPNPVDAFVIHKRRGVIVPSDVFKGPPLLAVPVMAQRSVAAVLRVGGDDGVPYTIDDLRLLDALASAASLALENSLLFDQVHQNALRDGLTGLLTHRAFQEALEQEILQASRYNQPLSLILTDVDHFKSINDTHGHPAGDAVLQGFAHVMVRNARDVDIVARYGGEEFVVLLPQMALPEATEIAEKIRQDLMAQEFDTGAQRIHINGSFGVASFPKDAMSAQQLVRKADERLYQAKKNGRNRVENGGRA